MRVIYIKSVTVTTLYFSLYYLFLSQPCADNKNSFFEWKLHSFEDKPTAAMLWQWRFLYKLPASFMFLSVVPESSVRTGWRGGQEPLPLKVAPNQPSVTPAFHLQSRRDSDCQMWEFNYIRPWTSTLCRLNVGRKLDMMNMHVSKSHPGGAHKQ